METVVITFRKKQKYHKVKCITMFRYNKQFICDLNK